MGKVWIPFHKDFDLLEVWKSYHRNTQNRGISISLKKCKVPDINGQESVFQRGVIKYAYQGVYAGTIGGKDSLGDHTMPIFFLENEWHPMTQASRIKVIRLPIEVGLFIWCVLYKYKSTPFLEEQDIFDSWIDLTQKKWGNLNSSFQQWLEFNLRGYFEERIHFLEKPLLTRSYEYSEYMDNDTFFCNLYQNTYLQKHKLMEINYEKGQIISFWKKEGSEEGSELEEALDLFPPMLFCKAANDKNRKYICCADVFYRKGYTLDHPFIIWLMKNAFLLDRYYQRQFRQIIDCIRHKNAPDIISEINDIRQQLISLPKHHGVDVNSFPQLSEEDFWHTK